jgi:hypothetical protein
MFVDIIFALFVIAAVGYFFYYFVLPRPSTILKELAGNRLRIEFVSPPIPSTPLQTVWFNILVPSPRFNRTSTLFFCVTLLDLTLYCASAKSIFYYSLTRSTTQITQSLNHNT